MNTKLLKAFALSLMIPLGVTGAKGQSVYSNLVMSLNPVAYWPLQETTLPPRYDMETNYGSLGPIANVYYASSQAQATNLGPIVGDSGGSRNFLGNANSFALVPTTDNRVSLQAGQPFSVEAWVRATGSQSYVAMVNQTGHNGNGGIGGANASSGWMLCQNYSASWTDYNLVNGNHPPAWSFHVFNGVGDSGGAEAEIPNTNCLTGAGGYANSWVYLCGVFDGTNAWLYVYSTNLNNTLYGGSNAMNLQLPITTGQPTAAGIPGPTVAGAQFSPDSWDPIFFGCNRGFGANPFHGFVGEVAIYTNALTFNQITNHYMAGTNGLGNYKSTVLGDNPAMYWRMDSPKWTYPSGSAFPAAANYGSAGSGMTNFNTGGRGANCGVYQPGTFPGATGPSYAGFGNLTNACAFNGLVGSVDAGYNRLLDPTGVTNNFTLVAWFRGNPMDTFIASRYNCLASHSDNSWKAQFRTSTAYGSKGAGSQPTIASGTYNVNDGKWHMYVLESTCTNGVGTNVTIYLDNGIFNATLTSTNLIPGSSTNDATIGGAPDSTYTQQTNDLSYNSSQQYFAGEAAHVAYFTNALTLSQIQSLYYTANPAPTIIRQPVSAATGLNGAFTNTVTVAGNPPFYYQWYSNNVAIAGATGFNLIINPVMLSDASTNYYVVITNTYGSITSSTVSLTIVSNIMFVAQFPITYASPITLYGGTNIDGTNYVGSSPTFAISAVGATPISYQWKTNGVAVGWATGSSVTFTNCQLGGPTNFQCVLANDFDSVTSQVWSVNYIPAPTAPFPQAVLAAQPIGYWRLNDGPDNSGGNDGTICTDYQSGNNGIYTNVWLANASGGTGYDPLTDPTETSVLFGSWATTASFAGSIGSNVDFSTPSGNAEFSVAVWANGYNEKQVANGGLVTKGLFNGEEFNIDTGGPTNALGHNTLRLEVRDAAGGDHDADATSVDLSQDSIWHFIVGVCDETNGNILLYFDGRLVASASMPANGGIFNSAVVPVMIGARSSVATSPGNEQFFGFLDDVAIYNYAMNPQQILGQYDVAGIVPYFTQQPPSSTNLDQGATLTISTMVAGSTPLTYQWFDEGVNSSIPGQTNATLLISDDLASDSYHLTVSNQYGTVNSSSVSVNVYSGKPQITTDVQNPFFAALGSAANNSVAAYGTLPLSYQWQFSANGSNWKNLADNSRISGSQGSALTINPAQATDAGDYQVVVANSYGSVTSSVAPLVVAGALPLSFYNGTGLGWKTGVGATFANGLLTLTSSGQGNGTFFFDVPQYIAAFHASFTYQAQYLSTFPLADGITFCLQDDPRGTAATGSGGGALGFSGISPSVGFQINIFPGNGIGGAGYGFGIDGGTGSTTPPGSVNLTNGPVDVSMNYANGNIAFTFSNEVGAATFSTNMVVGDITQDLGSDTAYVGFTGAFGGDTSIQTIQNFQFASIPSQSIDVTGGNAFIVWPGSVNGYTLQENSSVMSTNWINVTNSVLVSSNGMNVFIVPVNTTNTYYRLVLPLSQ